MVDSGSGQCPQADEKKSDLLGIDMVDIVQWFWGNKLPIMVITAVCTIAVLVYSFMLPTCYTAEVKLLPQGESVNTGLLSQVASFTGINLDSDVSFEQMYGKIVMSDRLLGAAIDHTWSHRDFAEPVTLFEIFDVGNVGSESEQGPVARANLLKKLRGDVVAFFRDDRSGYMSLRVTAPEDPAFAADLANFMVEQLDGFNQAFRSRQAEEQQVFVTERLAEAQGGLRDAADRLTSFLESNRSYLSSPTLMQRYAELEREVQAETSVWIELRRQVDLAKIERNKNMISINILDEATPPVFKSGPRHSVNGVTGIVAGFVLSLVVLLARDMRREIGDRGRTAG